MLTLSEWWRERRKWDNERRWWDRFMSGVEKEAKPVSNPSPPLAYDTTVFRLPPTPPPPGDEWWSQSGQPGVSVTYDIVNEATHEVVEYNVHPRVANGNFLKRKAAGEPVVMVRRTDEIIR